MSPAACPKHMVYGPCADVGIHGGCEVPTSAGGPGRCVFLDAAPPFVPAINTACAVPTVTATPRLSPPTAAPLILSELPENANSSDELRRTARRLVGSVDAVLFGDANWMRVRFPPSYRARIVHDVGLGAWPGINARDRNRVALEGELAALADLGVSGVHCVTGNHPYSGHRPDAAPVFDLDSTRLTALAATMGHRISVAASPHTPPTHLRAARTAGKAFAGAAICMVDQPSTAIDLAAFIADTRSHGANDLGYMPVVSVVLERNDFARWSQYPNARIPFGWSERVAESTDVAATGLTLALELAEALLAVEGTVGVLFASTADPAHSDRVADTFAALAVDLRRRFSASRSGAATPPGG